MVRNYAIEHVTYLEVSTWTWNEQLWKRKPTSISSQHRYSLRGPTSARLGKSTMQLNVFVLYLLRECLLALPLHPFPSWGYGNVAIRRFPSPLRVGFFFHAGMMYQVCLFMMRCVPQPGRGQRGLKRERAHPPPEIRIIPSR